MALPNSKFSDYVGTAKNPRETLQCLRKAELLRPNAPDDLILEVIQTLVANEREWNEYAARIRAAGESIPPSEHRASLLMGYVLGRQEYLSTKGEAWSCTGWLNPGRDRWLIGESLDPMAIMQRLRTTGVLDLAPCETDSSSPILEIRTLLQCAVTDATSEISRAMRHVYDEEACIRGWLQMGLKISIPVTLAEVPWRLRRQRMDAEIAAELARNAKMRETDQNSSLLKRMWKWWTA